MRGLQAKALLENRPIRDTFRLSITAAKPVWSTWYHDDKIGSVLSNHLLLALTKCLELNEHHRLQVLMLM